jgi:hypothetical protein
MKLDCRYSQAVNSAEDLRKHCHQLELQEVEPADYVKFNQAIFEIPCFVGPGNNRRVDALGDSGARINFIRNSIAIILGLQVDRSVRQKVRIGSGEAKKIDRNSTHSFTFRWWKKRFMPLNSSSSPTVPRSHLGKSILEPHQNVLKHF